LWRCLDTFHDFVDLVDPMRNVAALDELGPSVMLYTTIWTAVVLEKLSRFTSPRVVQYVCLLHKETEPTRLV
jgi:hypothetical protein